MALISERTSEPARLREQNKQEKLQRIKSAASELFTERGFDAATARDIAKRASVGLGTLFNYAKDKRDLIFLIFADDFDIVLDDAFRAATTEKTLSAQCVSVFRSLYQRFGETPELSRILLRELTFYTHERNPDALLPNRNRTVDFIRQRIREWSSGLTASCPIDENTLAYGIYFLYAGSVRLWIEQERPDMEVGIAKLREQIDLYLAGVDAACQRRSAR